MKFGKMGLVFVVVVVLVGAYALGYLNFLSPRTADVGFMFQNAPSNPGLGQVRIDGIYDPVLSSAQGGFVELKLGSEHTYQFTFTSATFTGSFKVPDSVGHGMVVIVYIDWNTHITSVVVRAR